LRKARGIYAAAMLDCRKPEENFQRSVDATVEAA